MYTPGKTYTASVYVNAPNLNGNEVSIGLWQSDGTIVYSTPLTESTGASEWKRISVTVTPTTTFGCIYFFVSGKNSSDVWFDCAQLEISETANAYNILENGDMERGYDDQFDQWSHMTNESVYSSYPMTTPAFGRAAVLLGRPKCNGAFVQQVKLGADAQPSDTYVASLWAKGDACRGNDSRFGITLSVQYQGGGESKWWGGAFEFSSSQWQYLAVPFNLDDGTGRKPIAITYHIVYQAQLNSAIFDKAQLIKDVVASYEYDENGNMSSVKDMEQNQQFDSNKHGSLSQMTDTKGNFAYYDYTDVKQQLIGMRTTTGLQYTIENDTHGNPLTSTIQGNPVITSPVTGVEMFVRNRQSGKFLSASGTQSAATANIIPYAPERNADQVWKLTADGTGQYRLYNTYHSANMRANSDGTGLQTDKSNTQYAQWKFVYNEKSDQSFRIQHVASGKYLTYDKETNSIGLSASNVNNWGQRWHLERKYPESSKTISSSMKYTPNSDFIDTVTDSRGIVTKYNYDQNTGVLKDVTAANQTGSARTVNYTYAPKDDMLESVSQQVGSKNINVQYSYNGRNQLTNIAHNGFNYVFTYDAYGNQERVSVGSRALVTNYYNQQNGKQDVAYYGNGQNLVFKYDVLGRLSEKWWNNQKSFGWTYNGDGQVGRHHDYVNGVTYDYDYDTTGRMTDWRSSNGTRAAYRYDVKTRLYHIKNRYYVSTIGLNKATITKYIRSRESRICSKTNSTPKIR